MLNLSSLPTFAQPQPAYVQVGQIPVGQESAQQRLQRIRPVEQAPNGRAVREDKPPLIEEKRSERVQDNSEQDKRKQAQQALKTKLEQAEHEQLKELAARDREVRAHEQAHKAVAGSYGGAIHFEYQRGPDGNRYAVGGEVSIDTSPESSPEATLAKARTIQRAANAPAEPSDQDHAVAAQAAQMEQLALQQLAQVRLQEQKADQSGAKVMAPDLDKATGRPAHAQTGAKAAEFKPGSEPTETAEKPANNPSPLQAEEPRGKRLSVYRHEAAVSLNFHTHA